MQAIYKWILSFLLDFLWAKISGAIKEHQEKQALKEKQKEQAKKYSEVVNNPNATREERKNAEQDFLNG